MVYVIQIKQTTQKKTPVSKKNEYYWKILQKKAQFLVVNSNIVRHDTPYGGRVFFITKRVFWAVSLIQRA